MTIPESIHYTAQQLHQHYEKSEALNIADLVVEYITGLSKNERVSRNDQLLDEKQRNDLDHIISRLKNNEPVQYALGESWFGGMKFRVNKNVLIPRPETEELADWVFKEAKKINHPSIIDVGTGSGIIPVYLKKLIPGAAITAIDVCSEALFTATENALLHETEVNFILQDFLDEGRWQNLGEFDIIVSNPPYVRKSERDAMLKRVTGFEPHLALFVPDDDALLFYRKLADFSKRHLKPGGSLFAEINESLGTEVVELFREKSFNAIELRKDMQGKDRMIRAVK